MLSFSRRFTTIIRQQPNLVCRSNLGRALSSYVDSDLSTPTPTSITKQRNAAQGSWFSKMYHMDKNNKYDEFYLDRDLVFYYDGKQFAQFLSLLSGAHVGYWAWITELSHSPESALFRTSPSDMETVNPVLTFLSDLSPYMSQFGLGMSVLCFVVGQVYIRQLVGTVRLVRYRMLPMPVPMPASTSASTSTTATQLVATEVPLPKPVVLPQTPTEAAPSAGRSKKVGGRYNKKAKQASFSLSSCSSSSSSSSPTAPTTDLPTGSVPPNHPSVTALGQCSHLVYQTYDFIGRLNPPIFVPLYLPPLSRDGGGGEIGEGRDGGGASGGSGSPSLFNLWGGVGRQRWAGYEGALEWLGKGKELPRYGLSVVRTMNNISFKLSDKHLFYFSLELKSGVINPYYHRHLRKLKEIGASTSANAIANANATGVATSAADSGTSKTSGGRGSDSSGSASLSVVDQESDTSTTNNTTNSTTTANASSTSTGTSPNISNNSKEDAVLVEGLFRGNFSPYYAKYYQQFTATENSQCDQHQHQHQHQYCYRHSHHGQMQHKYGEYSHNEGEGEGDNTHGDSYHDGLGSTTTTTSSSSSRSRINGKGRTNWLKGVKADRSRKKKY